MAELRPVKVDMLPAGAILMTDSQVATDSRANYWAGVLVPALIPCVIAAGFVYAAMTPTDEWKWSAGWVIGLLLMGPVEAARFIVFGLLGDALKSGGSPEGAIAIYLRSMRVMLLLLGVFLMFEVGPVGMFYLLINPNVMIPALVLFGDGVITLFYFRGDAREEAYRISAAVEDMIDWWRLSLFATPLVIALIFGALVWLRNHDYPLPPSILPPGADTLTRLRSRDFSIPDWMPNLDMLRCALLLNVAVYHAFKAAIIANVHTKRFAQRGERMLSAKWIQRLGS
jgi:multisubunit Na+/H+ antiporter MnhC subunit